MIEKNEEKEKSGAGIRTSPWLWIVDLFGDYNHFPGGLTRFLKQFYSARYIYVWCCLKTEEKRNFAIKVFREKFKEDGE